MASTPITEEPFISLTTNCINQTNIDTTSIIKVDHFKREAKEVIHTNGLTVVLLESYKCDLFGNDFLITDSKRTRDREILQLKIGFNSLNKQPPGNWLEKVKINDTLVWYKEEISSAGMGGNAYTIIGWKSSANGYIEFELYKEAEVEFNKSDFDVFSSFWPIIETAYIKKLNKVETK